MLSVVFPLLAQDAGKGERAQIERLIDKGGDYFRKAEYKKALESSKEALARSFLIDDDYLIAQSYNTIGVVYDEFADTDRAIEFYNKALKYANRADNDTLRDWLNSNLGTVYYYNRIDVRKGIAFYKRSLHFAEKTRDSVQICYTRLNIAGAYFALKEYEPGIRVLEAIRPYIQAKGEQEARMILYSLDALYHSNHRRFARAESAFAKALAIARKEEMSAFEVNLYENLADHHKRAGNAAKQAFYQKKHDALHRELYPPDHGKALEETARQIQLDEYKDQLEKIEADNQLQRQKMRETRLLALLFGLTLLFVVLYANTLFRNNAQRKRLNAELLRKNEELQQAKDAAEEVSRLKTQFVSNISHELRTPLYGVIGITDIFLEKHRHLLDDQEVNSLKFSARYLLSLVNDVLQLNKVEARRITLTQKPFELRHHLRTIVDALQVIADKNGNTILLEVDPTIPEWLESDELRLSQILINLIGNALKFTQNGQIKVAVERVGGDQTDCELRFTVADNGIGIPKKDQLRIFERFEQVDRKEGDYQGTGLGLAIVKRLLELFGSVIELESEEGKGTAVRFTLRLRCGESDVKPTIASPAVKPLRILVVEDNKINQMVTRSLIKRFGHLCDVSDDGWEALERIRTHDYDLVLMDINMPGLDGYETTVRMRQQGVTIPIVALTAFDRNEIEENVRKSGMDGVIVKPFNPEEFNELLAQITKKPIV